MVKNVNPKDEARAAISTFVRGSIPMFRACLELTAQGIPETDAKGKVIRDENGCIRWAFKPAPDAALKTAVGLVDFYMPKLTASKVQQESTLEVTTAGQLHALPMDDLLRLRQNLLQNEQTGAVVDLNSEVDDE